MAMEFWGVEVKAGQPLKVKMDEGRIIHVSQAALGEVKKGKGSDSIPLFLEINGKKFVVGSLSSENIPQATFDLVFEKDFELSHGGKSGSVYFCGYSTDNPFLDEKDEDDFSDSEEDVPEDITANGKIEAKPEEVKPAATKGKSAKPESSSKQKVTVPAPKKEETDDSDGSDDSEEGSSDDDDEAMLDASDDQSGSEDDSDDDSDDSEDEEETPKKAEVSKKRSHDSAAKTPVPAKKAKIVTPQKTDGKKGAHTATPHPSKKTAAKTPATGSNSKDKSPKSEGKITCGSCTKTFNSDNALQAHSKAKHAAK